MPGLPPQNAREDARLAPWVCAELREQQGRKGAGRGPRRGVAGAGPGGGARPVGSAVEQREADGSVGSPCGAAGKRASGAASERGALVRRDWQRRAGCRAVCAGGIRGRVCALYGQRVRWHGDAVACPCALPRCGCQGVGLAVRWAELRAVRCESGALSGRQRGVGPGRRSHPVDAKWPRCADTPGAGLRLRVLRCPLLRGSHASRWVALGERAR